MVVGNLLCFHIHKWDKSFRVMTGKLWKYHDDWTVFGLCRIERDCFYGLGYCCMDGLRALLWVGTVGCIIVDRESGEPTRPTRNAWNEKVTWDNDKPSEQV